LRILIAEDDPSLAEALQFSLRQAGYAVDWIDNGIFADHALGADIFDLLILDLGLPKIDGLEVLRRLRKRNSQLSVIILSGREDPSVKVQGLDLGADDYLAKPFSLDELHARVRALLRRSSGAMKPQVVQGKLQFDTVKRALLLNGAPVSLSQPELGVLEVLLLRAGRVVSKEQLIEQLYNYDHNVSQNAIEVYVHRLRKKIDGAGVTIRTAYGQGYVLEAEPTI
jgi:two-component system, OmpR family, response regulator